MAKINEILKDPKAQPADKIKPIELDEVVVKVLSKQSEANLSQPESFLYNKYKTKSKHGTGLKLPRVPIRGQRRTMDAFQAMNLVKDSGVRIISDEPAFSASFFPKTMNIKKDRRGNYRSFRAHANPTTKSIYVKNPSLGGTLKSVLAESAHMPKYENPHTGIAGLAYGACLLYTSDAADE